MKHHYKILRVLFSVLLPLIFVLGFEGSLSFAGSISEVELSKTLPPSAIVPQVDTADIASTQEEIQAQSGQTQYTTFYTGDVLTLDVYLGNGG